MWLLIYAKKGKINSFYLKLYWHVRLEQGKREARRTTLSVNSKSSWKKKSTDQTVKTYFEPNLKKKLNNESSTRTRVK